MSSYCISSLNEDENQPQQQQQKQQQQQSQKTKSDLADAGSKEKKKANREEPGAKKKPTDSENVQNQHNEPHLNKPEIGNSNLKQQQKLKTDSPNHYSNSINPANNIGANSSSSGGGGAGGAGAAGAIRTSKLQGSSDKKSFEIELEEKQDIIGDLPSLVQIKDHTLTKQLPGVLKRSSSSVSGTTDSFKSAQFDTGHLHSSMSNMAMNSTISFLDDNASVSGANLVAQPSMKSNVPVHYELKVKLKEGKNLAIRDIGGKENLFYLINKSFS